MSQFSVAIWKKLPPISERSSCVHRASCLKNAVSQNTMSILKPLQKHLQPIEDKRAMMIMDNLVTKVLIVGSFPKIMENLEKFGLLLGSEAVEYFRRFISLAKELEECRSLIGNKSRKEDDQCTPRFASNLEFETKTKLYEIARCLLRCICRNEATTIALLKHCVQWDAEPEPAIKHLGSLLVQMRFLIRQALLSTTKEKTKREEYQKKAERRAVKQAEQIADMMTQFMTMTEEHNKMIEKKSSEIDQIRFNLIELERSTATKLGNVHHQFVNEYRSLRDKHKSMIEMLNEDLNATRNVHNRTTTENRAEVQSIRKKKWMSEDELDAKIKSTDVQSFEIKEHIDLVTETLNAETAEMAILLTKYLPIKAEYDKIMEERRLHEEELQKEREEKEQMICSATFIQNFWRAWKTRKNIRQHKKTPVG